MCRIAVVIILDDSDLNKCVCKTCMNNWMSHSANNDEFFELTFPLME